MAKKAIKSCSSSSKNKCKTSNLQQKPCHKKAGRASVVRIIKAAPAATKTEAKHCEGTPKAKGKKNLSQKLLEAVEKRKKAGAPRAPFFGRPKRRGRRPRNSAEYVPMHQQEEDSYVLESEYEGLELDTGIKVGEHHDDNSMSFERLEDFDEELNFDW
ncbi:MAG: hypothetical protein HY537_11690 [Deltaproteobacteria bacterium]|nr:hypothetical protein [Deltaproteobacteria bacterium]